jgi:acyl-CoA thioester hydrolase/thioesterase-3
MEDKEYSIVEAEITVRPDDIDMNNHVHYSKYLDYLLTARYIQMEKDYKMSMEEFLERGMTWFAKSVTLNFKRALKLGDIALVKAQIQEIHGAVVKINFWIYKKGSEKIYVDGSGEFTLLSITSGRPLRIPEDVIEKYSI